LRIVDVTDPESPAEVGLFVTRGEARAMAVSGRHAYVVGPAGLQVIDVANPAAAVEVGFSTEAAGATHLEKEASHLFLAGPGGILQVFNVYDPTNPTLVHTYPAPGSVADLAVAVGYVFLATGDAGLYVVDLWNPCDEIIEVGSLADPASVRAITMLKPYPLPITSVVYELLRWGLLILPLVSLAHLIHNRILERRLLGTHFHFDPGADVSIGFAFVLFLLWTLYEISKLTR
jgi:hypothetical protein